MRRIESSSPSPPTPFVSSYRATFFSLRRSNNLSRVNFSSSSTSFSSSSLLKFQRWMNEEEEEGTSSGSASNCVCSRAQDFFSRSTPRSTRYMAWPGFSAGVTWLIRASSSFSPHSFLLSLSLTRAFFARRIRREIATSGIYIYIAFSWISWILFGYSFAIKDIVCYYVGDDT